MVKSDCAYLRKLSPEGSVVLVLSEQEARAMRKRLGLDGLTARLKDGLSFGESELCYDVFTRLSDIMEVKHCGNQL